MTIDDQTLFAWIDGMLPAEEQARIARLVAEDPALAERVDRQEALAAAARESFRADLDEPVPDAWIARIDAALPAAGGGRVESLAAARERRRLRWTGWHAGAAAAAALVAGLLLGRTTAGGGELVGERGGVLVAAAPVAKALDGARSGLPVPLAGGRSLEIRLSLRSAAGDYCREALVSGAGGGDHLLACRGKQGWRIAGLAHGAAARGGYEAVGGDSPLDPLLDGIGGEPLDAAAEQAAIAAGWKR
ncbi:MAG TPA: hypothetical protein VF727_02345 [Allosphingosinicella sp.]|jgi:anti-sigma factor RsiW